MPAARMPLVGRREEMAALEDEFARAAAGEFRVVLLSGEAGVGKSRLGRELLARHPEAAGTFARAHPLGVTAAFGVWAEAIDPLLRDRSDAQVRAACGGLVMPTTSALVVAPRFRTASLGFLRDDAVRVVAGSADQLTDEAAIRHHVP